MTLRNVVLRSALLLSFAAFLLPSTARPYSVLSHEEVVDMAWKTDLVPLLRARFPGITDDELRSAHAYAYGGSVIQDIGYYPFGSHYFSDLLHYVRPNDFVSALLRGSTTPDEYAFALGALAHYCGDTIGHPYVNQVTALQNLPLRTRFGRVVTYEEDPTAHVRTEFGFDVVEVAQGNYSQQNYRDFIGFQVAKPLLERAFLETYGIQMSAVIAHEDLAIATYRRSVSTLIPEITKLAFVNYKDQIQQAAPGATKQKFLYRLDKTEYARDFGTDQVHVGVGGHIAAFFLHIVPKIGPFKALKVSIPNADEQTLYLKSINSTVDEYRHDLGEISAAPAPLPPPDPADAEAAKQAAAKLEKDASKAGRVASAAKDTDEMAAKQNIADNVQQASDKAAASAAHVEATVAAAQAGEPIVNSAAIAADTPIQPPTVPALAELDMDTGKPSAAGEYFLADQTYARLLADLVKPVASAAATPEPSATLVTDIEHFFSSTVAPSTPLTKKELKQEAALKLEIQHNLVLLAAQQMAPPEATH